MENNSSEKMHVFIADGDNGGISEIDAKVGIDLGHYFEHFSEGEGYSSPFECRGGGLWEGKMTEVEAMVVVFMTK